MQLRGVGDEERPEEQPEDVQQRATVEEQRPAVIVEDLNVRYGAGDGHIEDEAQTGAEEEHRQRRRLLLLGEPVLEEEVERGVDDAVECADDHSEGKGGKEKKKDKE